MDETRKGPVLRVALVGGGPGCLSLMGVAEDLVGVISYPAATSVAEFADGRVVFLGYPVGRNNPLAGVTLKELGQLSGIYRLVVAALSRKRETVVPRGEDTILEGDIVYFLCRKEELSAVNYLFGFEKRLVVSSTHVIGITQSASVIRTQHSAALNEASI